jgi:predicted permease
LLSIAAGVLLLLACANVANLLLARGESRVAEAGVRVALGASALRVGQPVVLEGLALGALGGLGGLLLAAAGLPALLRLAPADLAGAAGVRIDARVALFAVVVSILTALVFTAAPAWHAMRRAPADLLRSSGRGRTGPARGLRILVASQAALATSLLIAAALLASSLDRLNAVAPGLDTASRVTLDLTLPPARYRDAASIAAFCDLVRERLASLAGAGGVTVVRNLPLRDRPRTENVLRTGSTDREALGMTVQAAAPGVLPAMGIPLAEGRDLSTADRAGTLRVGLVNRTAAQALWPGESAIGRRLDATFMLPTDRTIEIVGVYEDVRSAGLSSRPAAEMILPIAQGAAMTGWLRNLTVVLQSNVPASAAMPAARAVLREIDPSVAAESPTTMEEVRRASIARERFLAALLAVFGALALVVAAVGVFGVVSFTVARQTKEFAIRNALGARRSVILGGVLASTAVTAGAGALAGAAIAWSVAPALGGFLYEVAPRNALVLAGAPLALVTVALASSFVPALRATRLPLLRALHDGE